MEFKLPTGSDSNETENKPAFDRIPICEERWQVGDTDWAVRDLAKQYGVAKVKDEGDSPIADAHIQLRERMETLNGEVESDTPNLYEYRDEYPEPAGEWHIDDDGDTHVYTADEPGPFDPEHLETRRDPLFVDVEFVASLLDALETCDENGYYVTKSDGGSAGLVEAVAYLDAETATSGNGWGPASQQKLVSLLSDGGLL